MYFLIVANVLAKWQTIEKFQKVHEEEEIPEEYLIVTPDEFIPALLPLIQWRQQEGLQVTVQTIQEIKNKLYWNGLLSAEKLREYFILYYNQQPCLTYILLVGDVEYIPVRYKDDVGTDLYYSLLDDTADLFPDVYLGRLPTNTIDDVRAIVEKIILYEKMVPSKKVLFASHFQDQNLDGVSERNYIALSERFRTFLCKRNYECTRVYDKTFGSEPKYYSDLTPIPPDLHFEGNVFDIIRSINSGVSIINHRAQGNKDGWVHPQFTNPDLAQLSNKRYPIILNINSSTGKFDQETEKERRETEGTILQTENESWSERMLFLKQAGAVALIAPTRITYYASNDIFNQGMIASIWPKMIESHSAPVQRLGQVLYRGRIMVVQHFGENGWMNDVILENFRQYHILGDPALRIRQPQ